MKINHKLGEMAEKETSLDAKGLLFGECMVKGLGKHVATYTALEKVQDNMRKVFGGVVSRAGRRDLMPDVDSIDPSTISCTGVQEEDFKVPLDSSLSMEDMEDQGVGLVEEAIQRQVQEGNQGEGPGPSACRQLGDGGSPAALLPDRRVRRVRHGERPP
ncbi:coiled-coil domain-containing protein 28B isoform X2 [Lissotriton helveticus]